MDLHRLSEELERISAGYARANGFDRDDAWFLLKLQEEMGELAQAYLAMIGQGRDRGRTPEDRRASFDAELADVLGHVLVLARRHDVDLDAALDRKWLCWAEAAEPERQGDGGSS